MGKADDGRMQQILDNLNQRLQALEAKVPKGEAPVIRCAACEDRGWLVPPWPTDHPRSGKPSPCPYCETGAEVSRNQIQVRFKRASLPQEYQEYTMESWIAQAIEMLSGKWLAYYMARELVEQRQVSVHTVIGKMRIDFDDLPDFLASRLNEPDVTRNGLVFYGPDGTGKTGLMAAAFNTLVIEQGIQGLYMRVQHVLTMLRDTWRGEDSELELLRDFETVPLLFLDDFNVEENAIGEIPSHQRDYMEQIMRERIGNQRMTLITTNRDDEAFKDQWGERTHEMVMKLHWAPMGGPKLRDTRQIEGEF